MTEFDISGNMSVYPFAQLNLGDDLSSMHYISEGATNSTGFSWMHLTRTGGWTYPDNRLRITINGSYIIK